MFGFLSSIISGGASTKENVYVTENTKTEDGLTGVEKYLKTQKTIAKGSSGVDKYLKAHAQLEKSGVAKYVARRAIEAKKAKENQPSVTGVAKYLENNIDIRPVKSGVSKYLSTRKTKQVSSVSKYVLKQSLITKENPVAVVSQTGVAKYLASKPTTTTSRVAKYLAQQVIAAKNAEVNRITEVESEALSAPLTGVEKYLSQQSA